MSDNTIRHIVSGLATFVCLLIFFAAYVSGTNGWWWTFPSVGIIYYALYHLIEA